MLQLLPSTVENPLLDTRTGDIRVSCHLYPSARSVEKHLLKWERHGKNGEWLHFPDVGLLSYIAELAWAVTIMLCDHREQWPRGSGAVVPIPQLLGGWDWAVLVLESLFEIWSVWPCLKWMMLLFALKLTVQIHNWLCLGLHLTLLTSFRCQRKTSKLANVRSTNFKRWTVVEFPYICSPTASFSVNPRFLYSFLLILSNYWN